MAASKRLSLVLGGYPHVAGIADGSVPTPGVEFEPVQVANLQDAFKRMCREVCFDVCEMSITGYLLALRYGLPFTALPVFPVRGFPQSHAAISVRRDSGITTPRQLEGRKVGARAYTGTASLWVRGALQDDYGVDVSKVTWISVEDEHVPKFGEDAPSNVTYQVGRDLAAMISSGEIDAAIGVGADEDLVSLIHNARQAAAAFSRRTGVLQINHTVVVRNEVLAENPQLARDLYRAFVQAKQRWLATKPETPLVSELALADYDPLPYGVDANRASLEALFRYGYEQGLTTSLLNAGEAFAKVAE